MPARKAGGRPAAAIGIGSGVHCDANDESATENRASTGRAAHVRRMPTVMGVAEPAPAAESRSGCVPASSNASIKTDWSVCVQRGMKEATTTDATLLGTLQRQSAPVDTATSAAA